jgi:Zinc finger C-x8-C-x5-C-x3-H type (and similar)
MPIHGHGTLFIQGAYFKGSDCTFTHTLGELREIPNLYKTKLCTLYQCGKCPNDGTCKYAHGIAELRILTCKPESQVCIYFQQGHCRFGDACKFLHLPSENKYIGMKNYSSTFCNEFEYPAYGMQFSKSAAILRATPTKSELNIRNQISDYPSMYSASGWLADDSKFFDGAFIGRR